MPCFRQDDFCRCVTSNSIPSQHVTSNSIPSQHVTSNSIPSQHATPNSSPSQHVTPNSILFRCQKFSFSHVSQSKTFSTAVIATSIISSSGSLVVSFCRSSPGLLIRLITALSDRPASRSTS